MKPKKVLLVTAALLLAGGGGYAYWRMGGESVEVPFVTIPVQRGNITQVVSSTGTLQAVVTVQVGSQVSGTIEKLFANFNSKVTAGQVVAQLNPDKFRAAVDQAKANLIAAQSNFAKAKVSVEDAGRTLARTRELRQRELTAQSELDAAQTAHDAAVAQLEVNKAQVAQAQASVNQFTVDLNNTVIRSPVDGIVISRNVDVGQTVAASLQAPTLFTIANDLSKMEVHTNVDEADVGNVWEGQQVTFTVDAFPAQRFRGKVLQVRNAPVNVQGVVTYNAVVRIDNKELLLKPGMTANVQFLVSRQEDVLTIPNMALRFKPPDEKDEAADLLRQDRGRVAKPVGTRRTSRAAGVGGGGGGMRGNRSATIYVLKGNKAQPIEVQLGITDGSRSEVRPGSLQENDPVIIATSSAAGTAVQNGIANPFQPQPQRGRGLGGYR
ncbi:MAG TPA: efflux RND transporter periplasmic adaptor subunit [Candidatus Binatia bacterium]|nr:efflux RND transporter periplasmic adaptor subunit [Candidatus Binatia bacterium]